MIFLANRANLDTRQLLTRLHNWLQTQVTTEDAPIEQVWYHTSAGNKVGVRATISAPRFLETAYPVAEAELQISFDFPSSRPYDFYKIQWVEAEREFMLGWHQDDTHMDLGECHLQLDYQGETVQRAPAAFLDTHPLNVFDQRIDRLVELVDAVSWKTDQPRIPDRRLW
ncbi:hypothetical protein Halru_0997 [Halovivax ruber XH-70]|uniref:Uncharacterized protein n=1 Tax=Halovivax ruber (strain DSM 18193 / JCM 13892 / XH-70) TaxID=797302 RepID=L0IBJ2_HALRX|nr:hypothetical protein [Halovivax ruber]AGB15616.1 hypothetical protein Halru_0997 [Halovivax ruber XH-70]